ncbi:AAA family ATPase [Streptomyces sp. NPDC085481]|uniref:helix-turn-helix transcriptional regulator n=1 Tax=Streptomyces sp. NPDC085481 TaxID=3365727 RepID=UPI0037D54FB9
MNTITGEGCVDRAPFAGRRAELALLEELLGDLGRHRPGGPAAVDITGEPGIGKSRLLAELTTRARRAGLTVLHGRATQRERNTPFQVFADAFADLGVTGAGGAELTNLWDSGEPFPRGGGSGDRLAPADRIRQAELPDQRCPAAAPPCPWGEGRSASGTYPAGGTWTASPGPHPLAAPPRAWPEPYGFFRRTAEALARVAEPGLLVVLDDLHGADRASLDLLDHLLRHPVAAPVLLVLARREQRTPPALASLLARAAECGTLARMVLGPLDPADCADDLAPGLPGDRAAALHTASGGNPAYFLALAAGPGSGGALAVLFDELAPLEPLPRAVVDAVALLGDEARTDLLPAVTASGPEEFGAAVRELVRLDLVRPHADGRTLALRHPALAELVRRAMDPLRRRDYHRRAADGLARAGAPVTVRAGHVEQYLTHWEPAAAATLVDAAERTEATDPALSARRLGAVLAVLPDTPEHHDARVELKLRRARALGDAGRVEESRDLLHRLLGRCGANGRGRDGGQCHAAAGEEEPRTAAVLLCAFMERHLGRYREADALIRRELRRHPGPSPSLRLRLVVEWGCRALFERRFPEVRTELSAILADARARGDDAGRAEALTLGALGEAYEGRTAAALTYVEEAAALIDAMTDGELTECCEALVRLGWSEIFLDDRAAAERHTTRGITLARRAGRPFALSQLLLCAAYVHSLTGRVETALGFADEALSVAETLGGAEVTGFSRAIRASILLHARPLGDPEPLAAAEEAVAVVGTAAGWWGVLARSLLAPAIPPATDPHRVRDVLLTAGGGPGLPRIQASVRPTFLELLVTACLAAGDETAAHRAARLAEEEAERLGLAVQRAAALRGLARLRGHAGEPAAAAELFVRSAQEYARTGVTLREAHTLLLGAPAARAAGDEDGAAAMWRRARRLAEAGGARLLVDLADRTRTAALGPGPEATAAPEADGPLAALTPREREISALVAEGLTNQAVADRLCLSPRTVESHVARVYRKTGVMTRAGLASLVARATS